MGRYDLNLSESEFWELTLKEFNVLTIRYENNNDWLNYRVALICSILANIWRGKNTKSFQPDDFMPRKKSKVQTPEQMFATVKMLNIAFGGTVSEDSIWI